MQNRIHVTNLPTAMDALELGEMFAPYGTVCALQIVPAVAPHPAGNGGLINMSSDEEGDAAIAALNGHSYRDRILAVGWSTTRDETDAAGSSLFSAMNIPADEPAQEAVLPPLEGVSSAAPTAVPSAVAGAVAPPMPATTHAWFSMEAAGRIGSAVYRKPGGSTVNVTRTNDDMDDRGGRRTDDKYVGKVVRAEDGGCVHETRKAPNNS